MAKSKTSSKAEAPSTLKSVKAGRVTKPAEDSKKKSKDVAKSAAKAHQKVQDSKKKRKDSVKAKSDSESSSASSDSSASSESESEMSLGEKPTKASKASKVNGAKKPAKAAKAQESSDSESSASDSEDDSSDSSEAEAPAPKANGVSKTAKAAKKDESSDSESDSDSSESDEEKPATNGVKADLKKDSDDDSSDDSSADASDEEVVKAKDVSDESDDSEADSDASDSSEEEEEKPAAKEPESKKRKAEADTAAPVKRVKQNGEPVSEPSKNLFVGSLSWNVDEDWLAREFEGFGEIVGVRVITRPEDGRSKGFGYVEFNTIEDATKALDAKQGAMVDGREINIDFGKVRPDRSYNNDQVNARAQKFGDRAPNEPSATLFVGNISFNADQDMITEAFSEYGNVNGVRLPTNPDDGNMKGFGYVEFSSVEEAQAAMEALNGADIAGRNIRLDFAGARPANGDSPRGGRGRGGFGGGRGRGGFDRGGRGGGRGRGGFGDRGGRGGGRGGSTNRGGFGDFKGKKISF
ncbi:putative nucleic acid binding protein 4 [Elsinoe australis]|uniref:Putative nucleic acid binding protein 4 n=1 Tax=Elsinoe australis TaxID=40998 RepID=A0A4U7B6C5_9PEZI|nr:putative nucleic acid binding protein 4 [Elsinoe australis]